MGGKTARTKWSKEPDEEPDYCDWKITLAIKKASDDPAARPLTRSSSSLKPKAKKTPPMVSSSVTFSVHRNILGPQSEYFNRIFKSNDSGGFSEARQQHSHIDFPSSISVKIFGAIVKAFEVILDYCYLEKVDFSFKGTSPVPLLYFCDYFQMEDDFEDKVEEYSDHHFYEMTSGIKLHLLYEQIIEFRTAGLNVERAQTLTAESCYNDEYCILSEGGSMATIADLPLWLIVVSFIQERGYDTGSWSRCPTQYKSGILSMDIANFLENNNNSSAIDSHSFEKLTDEKILPYVEANAALVLLKKEQQYVPYEVPINDDDQNVEQEELSLLTNLQNRCLESLVEARLELSRNKTLRDRAMKVMILLPRVVMGVYLNKTLNSYGEEKVMLVRKVEELTQEKTRERYKHDAKRRKIEQVSSIRLRNVEKELQIEKDRNTLLVAQIMNTSLF